MGIRLTRNDLKKMGKRCIRLPYSNPSNHITDACQKIGWNEGIYGWNWSAYTIEGFDGIIIDGYRSLPSWVIVPTPNELEELYRAYKQGPNALIKALENVQGDYDNEK